MNRALQSGKPTGGKANAAQGAILLDVKKPAASGKGAELTKDRDLQPSCDFPTFSASRLCLSLSGLSSGTASNVPACDGQSKVLKPCPISGLSKHQALGTDFRDLITGSELCRPDAARKSGRTRLPYAMAQMPCQPSVPLTNHRSEGICGHRVCNQQSGQLPRCNAEVRTADGPEPSCWAGSHVTGSSSS